MQQGFLIYKCLKMANTWRSRINETDNITNKYIDFNPIVAIY